MKNNKIRQESKRAKTTNKKMAKAEKKHDRPMTWSLRF